QFPKRRSNTKYRKPKPEVDGLTGDVWAWMKTKKVPNNKKNIYWRLKHKALPLGYRLKHINPENS
ncbi:36808_t:CDS:1, partial [Gigaspora margarita]